MEKGAHCHYRTAEMLSTKLEGSGTTKDVCKLREMGSTETRVLSESWNRNCFLLDPLLPH